MNKDLAVKIENNIVNLAIISNTIHSATEEDIADYVASKARESIKLIRELTAIILELEAEKEN